MRYINVPVEDAVYEAAKVAAAKRGMLFRRWVEEAVAAAADEQIVKPASGTKPPHDLTYVPLEEA